VVPAPRLELGYLSVPAFETGASAASARRAHALGARSRVRRPDGLSADFTLGRMVVATVALEATPSAL